MSALGHKRTRALQTVMSALPPNATLIGKVPRVDAFTSIGFAQRKGCRVIRNGSPHRQQGVMDTSSGFTRCVRNGSRICYAPRSMLHFSQASVPWLGIFVKLK